jgi:DNA primase
MRFDTELTERVRNTVNIVDLIGGYVRLRKRGQNYTALCPFHTEKTPSFSVSESKQIFKCFGCGAGGDAFAFVQRIENLSFPEAIHHLAERYGVPVPKADPKANEAAGRRARILELMQHATEFFSTSLKSNSKAQSYLTNRGIDRETIERFSLGFAPAGNQLLRYLKSAGYTTQEAELCGTTKKSDSGEYYDKFRNRIIFPICNLSGKTIAFGGRIQGDGVPKYLNSPETPLYQKGDNLYGLSVTRDEIRQRDFAVLVEGYFDCIVPYQFGIRNIVASLGTALTGNQTRVLGRYTRNVVVSFDPDTAGSAATLRSIDLFLAQGFHVNILTLPKGEDPDSFIIANGPTPYLDLIKNSSPYLDFLLGFFLGEVKNPLSPKGKQEIISRILPYLLKVPNRIERAEYLSRIASRIRVAEDLLVQEIRRIARHPRDTQVELRTQVPEAKPTLAESTLLSAVIEEKTRPKALEILDPSLFEGLRSESVFQQIFELKNQNQEISVTRLRDLIGEDDRDWLDHVTMEPSAMLPSVEAIRNSVDAIRRLQVNRLSREIQEEIAQEERTGMASPKLNELLARKESLRRQQHE